MNLHRVLVSETKLIALLCLLAPQLAHAQSVLTSGVAVQFSKSGAGLLCLPPGSTCYATVGTFKIDVPATALRLDVVFTADAKSTLVDGWMSFGKQPAANSSGAYSGDFYLGDASSGEGKATYTLTRGGTGGHALQAGTYYIALQARPSFTIASGQITATIDAQGPYLTSLPLNAASYYSLGVAPGEIITLKGGSLGPADPLILQSSNGRFPVSAGGTRVLFDEVPAPLLYVSVTQINAVVPFGIAGKIGKCATWNPSGCTVMVVESNGMRTTPQSFGVQAYLPGLFTADASGQGPVAALNQDGSVNSPAKPAKRSSIVALFGTGQGQTIPAGDDGAVIGTTLPAPVYPVEATIDGIIAEVTYAGAAPELVSGMLQVNVRVPANARLGCSIRVVIYMSGGGSYGSSNDGATVCVSQ
jgi:uncharacterized protein (TIGR03437 family)